MILIMIIIIIIINVCIYIYIYIYTQTHRMPGHRRHVPRAVAGVSPGLQNSSNDDDYYQTIHTML